MIRKLPIGLSGIASLLLILVILLLVTAGVASWYLYQYWDKVNLNFRPNSQTASVEKVVIGVKSGPLGFYGEDSVEYENPTFNFNANIFEGLTTFDKDLRFAKRKLVESWDNPDSTTWRLRLLPKVYFHDGSEFRAEDAKASIEFAKSYVVADDLVQIKTVTVVDPYTIEIATNGPSPLLLNNLINAYVMPKKVIDSQDFSKPIGTGPYKYVDQKDGEYHLEAFDKYYLGAPSIKNVTYKVIEDNDQRVDALLKGSVDLIEDIPSTRVADIEKAEKQFSYKRGQSLRVIFLGLDVASSKLKYSTASANPFLKKEVRQAIYQAINEDQIVKEVMGGHAYPASQPATTVNTGFNPDIKRLSYNPEKAKELLTTAGYPNGFDIVLDAPNNRYHNDEAIALKIGQQLSLVGIKVKVNALPKDDYFEKILDNNDTSFYLLGWSQDNGDAGGAYSTLLHTPVKDGGYGSFNIGKYSNSLLDKLIEESDQTIDPVKREMILKQIAQVAMDDYPIIPLHQQEDSFAISNKFEWTPRRDNGIRAFEISGK